MVANDILRKLRYILDFDDNKMSKVFELGQISVSDDQLSMWLAKDDSLEYQECAPKALAGFLNGLIIEKRGAREGEVPMPEAQLNNNLILRKLMIAYSLKSDDVIELLKLADLRVGKSEISAFFRKSSHRNYRECKSQVLRNFLMGLQLKEKGKISYNKKI